MQKAPGKHYRQGLSLKSLFKMLPNEAAAERWFENARWPNGIGCPCCGSVRVQTGAKHKTMPYRCRDCRKRFSLRTGTAMEGSNLGFQTWVIAVYLLTTNLKGISSLELHRELSVSQKNSVVHGSSAPQVMGPDWRDVAGPVEVDETYIGGRERNKHGGRKQHAGRGPVGKTAVLGAKDRNTNCVSAAVTERTDAPNLQQFVADHAKKGATVFTDAASAYHNMQGFEHESVRHSIGEYVRDQAHTNGVESFWSMLKRGYYGTYHYISRKHLGRYVSEFGGRHNTRPLDTIDQMKAIARGIGGKRLKFADRTA